MSHMDLGTVQDCKSHGMYAIQIVWHGVGAGYSPLPYSSQRRFYHHDVGHLDDIIMEQTRAGTDPLLPRQDGSELLMMSSIKNL